MGKPEPVDYGGVGQEHSHRRTKPLSYGTSPEHATAETMKDTAAAAARNGVDAGGIAAAHLRERVRRLVAEFYQVPPERGAP